MLINKKGLSNIIATVLIVLLALAAVAIVWSFIRPGIDQTGVGIDVANKCLNTELKPTGCSIDGTATADVTVQLLRGDVSGMKVVFDDGTLTEVETSDDSESPENTLETKTNEYTVGDSITDLGAKPIKVKVAAVVKDADNNDHTCDPSPTEFTCNNNIPAS
jgi:flagellar basal body-associated protein FliL